MVYVHPNTLKITPTYPYTTSPITAKVYVGMGGELMNLTCGAALGYTRTFIHLLMRVADKGITWAKASEVAMYDCSTQCCWDLKTVVDIPITPGLFNDGWLIEFPTLPAIPIEGIYEFMAIDEGDFKNIAVPDTSRVATARVQITKDPTIVIPPVVIPGDGGGGDECDGLNRDGAFDISCIMEPANSMYLFGAIGIVALVLLTSGRSKK